MKKKIIMNVISIFNVAIKRKIYNNIGVIFPVLYNYDKL